MDTAIYKANECILTILFFALTYILLWCHPTVFLKETGRKCFMCGGSFFDDCRYNISMSCSALWDVYKKACFNGCMTVWESIIRSGYRSV